MKINIFDRYNDDTKKLIKSLTTAGIERKNLFVHYDGDLPLDGISPFTFFTGYQRESKTQEGLFFNQVVVPAFYDIRHVDGGSANIEYLKRSVGKIFYRKKGYRLVDHVDWFSEENSNTVVKRDHYNSAGQHYASSYFSGNVSYKNEYYDTLGKTIIVEDSIHHSIQLFYKSSIHHFENMTHFFLYFLKTAQINASDIYINSLSFPLFISRSLNIGNKTTLFWQEAMGTDVPGNMRAELENPTTLKRIVFMEEKQLDQVKKQFPTTLLKLNYLSHIGEFSRSNHYRQNALILTNSDNIHGLKDILMNFPELKITIAAFTNMSTKLLHMEEEFNNIALIPSINEKTLSIEMEKADIYLDINRGLKVGDILEKAYQQNMMIFSYREVAQKGAEGLVFDDTRDLCNHLSYLLTNRTNWHKLLTKMIEKNGKKSTVQEYQTTLEIS